MKTLQPAPLYFLHNTLVIPLYIPGLPSDIQFGNNTYYRKIEFHVTVMASRRLFPLLAKEKGISETSAEEAFISTAKEVISTVVVKNITLTGEIRHTKNEDQETLILMCKVDGIKGLYDGLNRRLALSLEYPPLHITLYTQQQGGRGFALIDQHDLDTLTTTIDVLETEKLKTAMRFDEVFG